jgi:hypothetical protein
LRVFGPPQTAPAPPTTLLTPAHREWTVTHNLKSNRVSLDVVNDEASFRFDHHGLEIGRAARESYSFSSNDVDTVRGTVEQRRRFVRGAWEVETVTRTVLSSTPTHFLIRATLDAYEGESRLFSRSWDEAIPRDLV